MMTGGLSPWREGAAAQSLQAVRSRAGGAGGGWQSPGGSWPRCPVIGTTTAAFSWVPRVRQPGGRRGAWVGGECVVAGAVQDVAGLADELAGFGQGGALAVAPVLDLGVAGVVGGARAGVGLGGLVQGPAQDRGLAAAEARQVAACRRRTRRCPGCEPDGLAGGGEPAGLAGLGTPSPARTAGRRRTAGPRIPGAAGASAGPRPGSGPRQVAGSMASWPAAGPGGRADSVLGGRVAGEAADHPAASASRSSARQRRRVDEVPGRQGCGSCHRLWRRGLMAAPIRPGHFRRRPAPPPPGVTEPSSVSARSLVLGLPACFAALLGALFLDVHDSQPQRLGDGVVVRELGPRLEDLAHLPVERLDGVGRVEHPGTAPARTAGTG